MTLISSGYGRAYAFREDEQAPTAVLPDWVRHNTTLNAKCERLIDAGWIVVADYWSISCSYPSNDEWRDLPLNQATDLHKHFIAGAQGRGAQ